MEQDIRWEQRFSNYKKALYKLDEAVDYIKLHVINIPKDLENTNLVLDEIIREGLIQRFEYTHELAWNVMKDYAEYQGNTNITGSRDASREAFLMNLVKDGEVWMDMIKSRNKTSHTYNEVTASEIFQNILDHYHTAFHQFQSKMETLLSGAQTKLL
jgi:nucleotidyltransferase substrate binding protein (TIGR01987 family)